MHEERIQQKVVERWKSKLVDLPLQSKLRWSHSLKRFNTLRVGGDAACFIEVANQQDLSRLLPFARQNEIPWFILGKGSNLILPDERWPGIVLRLSASFKHWETFPQQREIYAGAALADVTLAQRCIALGWSGLEFLIGVPGCIGGAIAMNAGAHGREIRDHLKKVWWIDMEGRSHQTEGALIDFDYRYSSLNGKLGAVITSALFQMDASDSKTVSRRIEEYQTFREEKQPRRIPNCGSVFKNPTEAYAAELIESVGLKGHCRGDAQISELHSNFIVNLGNAKTKDVLALMRLARKKVWNAYQIDLEPEVQIVTRSR